ncbi:LysR family nitrogen assimilation transcriptional regulator [Paraburkholderia sp. GAS199]|uniref:LysR family transcriptional regulator n=1 Tax=Paraburkholderia sp. GAS199 TaxID=3035126 RepID=UPI003D1D91F1
MEIRQIRAFLAVADTGTVTRAAEMLHVVQPAVTRQIKVLEEELGAALFVRTRVGMQLTEAGNLFIERARRAVRELDIAREEIHPAEAGKLSGIVRIGLLPSSCDLIADALYAAMHEAFPYIQISLSVDYSDPLFKALISGELDATLLYNPSLAAAPALDIEPLVREPLCLVGLPHEIASMQPRAPVSTLGLSPLILPGTHHRLRSLVEHACAVHGVDISVAAETHALAVQKSLVIRGFGKSVIPRIAIRDELKTSTLDAVLIDESEFVRTIALAQPAPSARQTSQAVRCTARVMRDCIRQIVSDGHWPDAELIAND